MPAMFVLLWATGFIGAKYGLPYSPPLKFLLWRHASVIVLMSLLAWSARAAWPRGVQLGHVAVAGVLLQGGYLGGVFVAIDLGMSAGIAALIVSLQPILTAVHASATGIEPVSRRQWAGFVAGLGGVALVVSGKLGTSGFGWAAFGSLLIALLSITWGTLYQKRYCGAQDLRTQSVVQFAAAGLVLFPLSMVFEMREVQWTGHFVFALGWLVLVLSLGATSLLLVLIRHGAATKVSSFMYLVPPVTAVVAWLLFDERLTMVSVAGMVLAVVGVALVVRPSR